MIVQVVWQDKRRTQIAGQPVELRVAVEQVIDNDGERYSRTVVHRDGRRHLIDRTFWMILERGTNQEAKRTAAAVLDLFDALHR